jgi:HEPN domain-containing protein
VDVAKHVEHWRKGACEDRDVAEHLVRSGRFRHGFYFLHLAAEKALKALVCRATGSLPPRLHDLIRLTALAGLELSEDRRRILAEVNSFNLAGRYPETQGALPTRKEALELLRRAKEILDWLLSQ